MIKNKYYSPNKNIKYEKKINSTTVDLYILCKKGQ